MKADDKSSFQHKLKRIVVKAKNYSLINFASLGIHDLLCVPCSGAERRNVFNNFIIIFLIHSLLEKEFKRYRI